MFRLFALGVAIALVIWALRVLFTPRLPHQKPGQPRNGEQSGQDQPGQEKMVACKVCGLHVPESEACFRDDHSYCCPEHRDQDQ